MKCPELSHIGCVHCFRIEEATKAMVDNIETVVLDKGISAIVFYEDFSALPWPEADFFTLTVFVFHCFNRRAYDLYHQFGGKNIRVLDPSVVQSLLMSLCLTDAKEPMFYRIKMI